MRRLLDAPRRLREQQPALAVEAACAAQVSYPMVDLLGRALGAMRPWTFGDPQPADTRVAAVSRSADPFRSAPATIAGVPVSLRVQNQLDPTDRDNHSLLMHRIALAARRARAARPSTGCDGSRTPD